MLLCPVYRSGHRGPARPKAQCGAAQRTSGRTEAHTQPAGSSLSIEPSCLPAGVDYRMDWSSAGYNVLMPPGFGGLSFTGFGDSLLESWASGQQSKSRASRGGLLIRTQLPCCCEDQG